MNITFAFVAASLMLSNSNGAASWNNPVAVADRLQLVWDDYVVDEVHTTAVVQQHSPQFAERVFTFDAPWEGDCCFYENLVKEPWGHRIYYKALSWNASRVRSPGKFRQKKISSPICVIESRDGGRSWTRPDLGQFDLLGDRHNNCVFPITEDNMFVFKDPNPSCPPAERYKALCGESDFNANGEAIPRTAALWCFTSSDGIHFSTNRNWCVSRGGAYDTLNVASWDPVRQEYVLYVRDYHKCRTGEDRNGDNSVRGIRMLRSKDFHTWSKPKPLEFYEGEDYPLYTNGIHPYYRDPSVYIGFPARYVERKAWTPTYDRLCGKEARIARMDNGRHVRGGLTVWDTIFCFSRDGERFHRFNEAMLRPGPEHDDKNWSYSDTYVTMGEIETPGRYGSDPEISMFVLESAHCGVANKLNRYVMRLDGYVSRNAPYKGAKVVTKPLVFTGRELQLNFSTSGRGYVYVTVRDEKGAELKSHEVFGDKVDRVIDFRGGDLAAFAGRPVVLEFEMSDADLYSFRFK